MEIIVVVKKKTYPRNVKYLVWNVALIFRFP